MPLLHPIIKWYLADDARKQYLISKYGEPYETYRRRDELKKQQKKETQSSRTSGQQKKETQSSRTSGQQKNKTHSIRTTGSQLNSSFGGRRRSLKRKK
jgi:hypothetical protein